MPVSADGTAYDLSGPEDAPVVALIHGLGLTRQSTWSAVAPTLSREFRVLSYDLPGHGESALPACPPDLAALAGQLRGLMDELGMDRAALVGFSLGGMINRRLAMDAPERVSALAILNSPHERDPEAQARVESRARDTAAGGPAAIIDTNLARWFTDRFRHEHPDRLAQVRAVVLANDAKAYAAHRRVLAEGVTELIRPDPAITHPALVMTCECDSGSTPEMSHAIAREIPGAQTIIVPGLRHLGLIESPDAFTAPVAGFLRRSAGRAGGTRTP
ncbi:alpha/beta fold hydrolase [Roseovarius salinarum]|uniref:alpha/beta fold hydrolase n=1 Tax=Roseovarius salinarum TaxID=1981892 RepID=UPI000C34A9AE|nr:alpha/beta hydrolase [Roseovarius salinarum]